MTSVKVRIAVMDCPIHTEGPWLLLRSAHCSGCGMEFLWTDRHGEGRYDLPYRVRRDCASGRDAEGPAECFECGAPVLAELLPIPEPVEVAGSVEAQ